MSVQRQVYPNWPPPEDGWQHYCSKNFGRVIGLRSLYEVCAYGCGVKRPPSYEVSWPAGFYIYHTWEYALSQARSLAVRHQQKLFIYRGCLDGDPVWVVSWDPKKR